MALSCEFKLEFVDKLLIYDNCLFILKLTKLSHLYDTLPHFLLDWLPFFVMKRLT